MPANFTIALHDEIAELERELEADPRFLKLRELRRVLALYEGPNNFTTSKTVVVVSSSEPRVASGRRPSPERERVLEVAKMFLANRGPAPTPTRLVLDHLEQEGVQVGGEVPLNNLSAMLSNSSEFLSHGRSGWTLVANTFHSVINDLCHMLTQDELTEAASLWNASNRLPPHIANAVIEMAALKIGRPLEGYQFNKLARQLVEKIRFAANDLHLYSQNRT